MDEFRDGLGDAAASIAAFLPKLAAFLLILVIGYFVAKILMKVVDGVLERVGFDKAVERGGVKKALANSKYDASSLLAKVVFYTIFLFVLTMAFGVFGDNPISDMLQGVIAYLPKVFTAILIVVIGAAVAAGVKEIVQASIGGLSYGKTLANAASLVILVIAGFAALDQLEIAPNIVNGLFYAMLAIIVGSAVVAIGGGGIKTMQQYWDRAAQRAEREQDRISQEGEGAGERIKERAQERAQQAREVQAGQR